MKTLTLTLPQASMLYGNGYQLWDGDNIMSLDVHDRLFFLGNRNQQIYIPNIGTDYKIIVRKNDAITKPLEDGTIPIVECARIALYQKFRLRFDSEFVLENKTYSDTETGGKIIRFKEDTSYYRFSFDCNIDVNRLGFYLVRDNDISYYLNQRQLFQYLESKHFQLDLPDELCVSMEEINIKK